MNVFLTFDYELFFGSIPGTLEKSIIEPTNKLLKILDKYNLKAIFFVDSGYILKLRNFKKKYFILKKDWKLIINQIKYLHKSGHEIALHIHPHWEDSYFNGNKWKIITKRYRLHDFNEKEIKIIVSNYKKILEEIIEDKVISFRAGGWCIQPFEKIRQVLKDNGIKVDSTVFRGGFLKTSTHYFDFRRASLKDKYYFEDDPLIENKQGTFLEIPISSIKITPAKLFKAFYLKRKLKNKMVKFGDGVPIQKGKKEKFKLLYYILTGNYYVPVSFDSFKAILFKEAYFFYKNNKKENFVVISHPKSMTVYSLDVLEEFIQVALKNGDTFLTFKDIV